MKATYHAAQRFLERVIQKSNFSKYEVHRTVEYLEKTLQDVMIRSYKGNKEFKRRHNMPREKNILGKTFKRFYHV